MTSQFISTPVSLKIHKPSFTNYQSACQWNKNCFLQQLNLNFPRYNCHYFRRIDFLFTTIPANTGERNRNDRLFDHSNFSRNEKLLCPRQPHRKISLNDATNWPTSRKIVKYRSSFFGSSSSGGGGPSRRSVFYSTWSAYITERRPETFSYGGGGPINNRQWLLFLAVAIGEWGY